MFKIFLQKSRNSYIKINKYNFKSSEEFSTAADLSKILGKWLQISNDISEENSLDSTDIFNRDGLEQIQKYIQSDDKNYKISQDLYKVPFSTLEKEDSEIIIDFSDSTLPYIETSVDAYQDGSSIKMSSILIFSNIDNTVINANLGQTEVIENIEDFEKLIGGISQ